MNKSVIVSPPTKSHVRVRVAGVALILSAVAGASLVALGDPGDSAFQGPGFLALLFTGILLAFGPGLSLIRLARKDWFYPLASPLVYVIFAFMAPLLFLSVLDKPIGAISPSRVNELVVLTLGLGSIGLMVGVMIALVLIPARPAQEPAVFNHNHMLVIGRVLLALSVAGRLFMFRLQYGVTYGKDSVRFGPIMIVDNLASMALLSGIVLVVLANVALEKRVFGAPELAMTLVYALSSLLVGNRGDLMAPAIFLLWAHHHYVRPIKLARLAGAIILILIIFQGVLGTRSEQKFLTTPSTITERVLSDYVTPVFITSEVVTRVPLLQPFTRGDTYLAGLKRQLPSPIATALFGDPTDTATFIFRDMIDFTSPDSGFAFSLPSEGYLNFGLAGSVGAGLFAGLVLGYAYRRSQLQVARPINLLYPVLIATLPLSLRSDSLAQIKSVLYPMLFITLALHLSRKRTETA